MIPRLLSKVDEVLRLPHLSDFHAVEVRAIAERIESLFLSIRDSVDDRHYELLTATVDRLHREIALGETILDQLLKSTGSY
jgi:phage terminase Nu1 subunit (DNA packaging protein)